MFVTRFATSVKEKTTLCDMKKINNGVMKHEGLELTPDELKLSLALANGEISKEELFVLIGKESRGE